MQQTQTNVSSSSGCKPFTIEDTIYILYYMQRTLTASRIAYDLFNIHELELHEIKDSHIVDIMTFTRTQRKGHTKLMYTRPTLYYKLRN